MPSNVPLAPNNLVRPPVLWSASEVKAWLKFCIQEFALRPFNVDKFDMNGKALLLLTRMDFMQRAPHAGDVLFNAFQHLLKPTDDKLVPATNEEKSTNDVDSSQCDNRPTSHANDQEMESVEIINRSPNDDGDGKLLWMFIYNLLLNANLSEIICWESLDELTFRILKPTTLANAWGRQKNKFNMTYEKLARALRYYYKVNIIKKVTGRRLTYQFLQHPSKIKKGQRGARPRSSRVLNADVEEAITPDSSTQVPSSVLVPAPSVLVPTSSVIVPTSSVIVPTSSVIDPTPSSLIASRQLSTCPSSNENSPNKHYTLVESFKNCTSLLVESQDISHFRLASSSADSNYTTNQQESVPYYETTHYKVYNSAVNTDRSHNKSQSHSFQHPSYCDHTERFSPVNHEIIDKFKSSICSHDSLLINTQCINQNLADIEHNTDVYYNSTNSFAHLTPTSKYSDNDINKFVQTKNDNQIFQHRYAQDSTHDMSQMHNSTLLSTTYRDCSEMQNMRSNLSISPHTENYSHPQVLYKSYSIRPTYHEQDSTHLLNDTTSLSQNYWQHQHFHNKSIDHHQQNQQPLNELPINNQYQAVYYDQKQQNIKKTCHTSLPVEHDDSYNELPEDLSMKPSPKNQVY